MGARARSQVRRRPGGGVRCGQLGGRSPGVAGCLDAEPPRLPAWLQGYGHVGHRRRVACSDTSAATTGRVTPPRPRPTSGLTRRRSSWPEEGDRDTFSPRFVEIARGFVEKLRTASSGPVVDAELPGGHSSDLLHTIRFETVVDGIEAFAAWVRSTRARSRQFQLPTPALARRVRPHPAGVSYPDCVSRPRGQQSRELEWRPRPHEAPDRSRLTPSRAIPSRCAAHEERDQQRGSVGRASGGRPFELRARHHEIDDHSENVGTRAQQGQSHARTPPVHPHPTRAATDLVSTGYRPGRTRLEPSVRPEVQSADQGPADGLPSG